MDGTTWGLIHQKRKNEELASNLARQEDRYEQLKLITRKLLDEKQLTAEDKIFLNEEQI